jgi:hypothetical protein
VLDVVATSPKGGTAHLQRTVVFDVTPGQVLLDVTDPDGDDNGPGNDAYPRGVPEVSSSRCQLILMDQSTEQVRRRNAPRIGPLLGSVSTDGTGAT